MKAAPSPLPTQMGGCSSAKYKHSVSLLPIASSYQPLYFPLSQTHPFLCSVPPVSCVFQSTQPGVSLPICRRKCFITSERALICFIFHGHIHRKVRRILCIMTPKPAVSKRTAVKTMQSISYYCKQIHKKSFLGYPQHSFYFTVACMLLLDGV